MRVPPFLYTAPNQIKPIQNGERHNKTDEHTTLAGRQAYRRHAFRDKKAERIKDTGDQDQQTAQHGQRL